jgi:L-2-hydroxyglutarate oxidase
MDIHRVDVAIIGGGILGFSTAMQLKEKYPRYSISLLEKEATPAEHQTGHNSGVIHAGVYYKLGSLKAKFCRQGLKDIVRFCDNHHIPYASPGKLIVATDEAELTRMQALIERSKENQLEFDVLDQSQLKKISPEINGIGAIHVLETKIINWKQVTEKYADIFIKNNGNVFYQQTVEAISEHKTDVVIKTSSGRHVIAKYVICCTGLQADRMVKLSGQKPNFKIVPFRGEYYQLNQKFNQSIQHLIYPVPNPDLPFLGVHLTRMIDGSVTVGPNAVLAMKREGYKRSNLNLVDLGEILAYPAFWKMLKNNFKPVLHELKTSLSKKAYLKEVQKYCPSVTLDDLQPYPAGVRAQALSKDGKLVEDFLFQNSKRILHVCNAPSPAATSSLPIGRYIIEKFEKLLA